MKKDVSNHNPKLSECDKFDTSVAVQAVVPRFKKGGNQHYKTSTHTSGIFFTV